MKVELMTRLKRQTSEILLELNKTKEAVLITERGKPAAYLIDVDDYEFMQRRLSLLEALTKGEQALLENRTVTRTEAKARMGKWLK